MSTEISVYESRLIRESVVLKPAEDSFRQGWKETMAGETRPVSELWDDIDPECTEGAQVWIPFSRI
ncbi:MAG: hypothetical protein LAKADJCE_00567 [Candidatus Argoarchaeum ethanivorans]|uniref:Uncharacterized protein n=1 Tax=Candidatus Argoarchaeum ethanivorans TaxID=2608793 RepID=A0A811TD98_9EURY|nr:MAG: hypothetical protein LAKADJCE_00567 [Candidatus Argoarchaeum ethanivorans]